MPNWTWISLEWDKNQWKDYEYQAPPIFSKNENGGLDVDYNTLLPRPKILSGTRAPIDVLSVAAALQRKFEYTTIEEIIEKAEELGISNYQIDTLKKSTFEDIINYASASYKDWYTDEEKTHLEEGLLSLKAHEETCYWDWYDWSCAVWGVKWNASDSYFEEGKNFCTWMAPWSYPQGFFKELSKKFPNAWLKAEIEYEDDPDITFILEHAGDGEDWLEYEEFKYKYDFRSPKFEFYEQKREECETEDTLGLKLLLFNHDSDSYDEVSVNIPTDELYGVYIKEMDGLNEYFECAECNGYAKFPGKQIKVGEETYELVVFDEDYVENAENIRDTDDKWKLEKYKSDFKKNFGIINEEGE